MRDLLDRRPDFVAIFDKHPDELMRIGRCVLSPPAGAHQPQLTHSTFLTWQLTHRAPDLKLMLDQNKELKAVLDKKMEVRSRRYLGDISAISRRISDR